MEWFFYLAKIWGEIAFGGSGVPRPPSPQGNSVKLKTTIVLLCRVGAIYISEDEGKLLSTIDISWLLQCHQLQYYQLVVKWSNFLRNSLVPVGEKGLLFSPSNENTIRQELTYWRPKYDLWTSDLWPTLPTHLILLGELQVVIGLEELRVFCQLWDGDWRMIHHTCSPNGWKEEGHRESQERKFISTFDRYRNEELHFQS